MKNNTKKYEKLIIEILQAEIIERLNSDLKDLLIVDKVQQHYMILRTGWDTPKEFSNYIVIHFCIKQDTGKIWLLENNTDNPITNELVMRGIPPSQIVLGFHQPIFRAASGYAIN